MIKLKIGDIAPDFKGVTQHGREVSLSDFSDKKLVLYFYPKDNTPGCTLEACSLRDGYSELLKAGYVVIGVSPDSETSHKKFAEKHTLPFPLIADTDKSIADAYGVWGEKKFMGRVFDGIHRTTFVISGGHIETIFKKVDTKNHFNQILNSK